MAKPKDRSSKAQRKEESRSKKSKKHKPVLSFAARDSVLATPELLELIFALSSPRHLLIADQRVCRLWRDVISQSSRLQRQLFFLPEEEPDEKEGRHTSKSMSQNPLLRRAFQQFFFPGCHQEALNGFHMLELCGLPIADMKNGRKRHSAFIRTGASWRSMLVSQPPPKELVLIGKKLPGGGAAHDSEVIRLSGPVRMGTLYDLACYGALHCSANVVWGADSRLISEMVLYSNLYRSMLPTTSDCHNIVMLGSYPRSLWQRPKQVPSQTDDYWERWGIMNRIRTDGKAWMFLCDEYDAEAIDQMIEDAKGKLRSRPNDATIDL
ncbi:hypothetical protein PG995_003008 [Apiospora arundinis]